MFVDTGGTQIFAKLSQMDKILQKSLCILV